MRTGKLSSKDLEENVLNLINHKRKEVLVTGKISEDCSAIKSDDIILLSTDPITACEKGAGKFAIHISANDISASGGEPFACLITIIAPVDKTAQDIKELMTEITETANSLNIDIIGGHTEFSTSVIRTVVNVAMIGKTKKFIHTDGGKVGDSIIVTKNIGLEGTSILANDKTEELKKILTDDELEMAQNLTCYLSVLPESKIATKLGVSGMHDVTEGGIFGAVTEMCEALNLGAELDVKTIPILNITKKICNYLSLDYYRVISSGSMLITTNKPEELLKEYNKNNIKATIIGKITEDKNVIANFGDRKEILSVTPDELTKIV